MNECQMAHPFVKERKKEIELFACGEVGVAAVAAVGWIQYARRLLRFELLCDLFEDIHPLPFDGLVLCPQDPHAPRARQQEHALFVALLRLWENNNITHGELVLMFSVFFTAFQETIIFFFQRYLWESMYNERVEQQGPSLPHFLQNV